MVRCVALALVFGLVAGGVFVGTGYAGMKALGIDNNSKAQEQRPVQRAVQPHLLIFREL